MDRLAPGTACGRRESPRLPDRESAGLVNIQLTTMRADALEPDRESNSLFQRLIRRSRAFRKLPLRGLDPRIHVFLVRRLRNEKDVDGRDMPGHGVFLGLRWPLGQAAQAGGLKAHGATEGVDIA
jgi:hypothetical protein